MLSRLQYLWESCVGVKFMSLYVLKDNVRLVGFCCLSLVSASCWVQLPPAASCSCCFLLVRPGASWCLRLRAASSCWFACVLLVSVAFCGFLWWSAGFYGSLLLLLSIYASQ